MWQACKRWSAHRTYGNLNVSTVIYLIYGDIQGPQRHCYPPTPPPPPHLGCRSTHHLPPLELLLLWLDEPQLTPFIYCQLEVLLSLIIKISLRRLPAHLVGCLFEFGGHTNRYRKNRGSTWGAAWLQLIYLFVSWFIHSVVSKILFYIGSI